MADGLRPSIPPGMTPEEYLSKLQELQRLRDQATVEKGAATAGSSLARHGKAALRGAAQGGIGALESIFASSQLDPVTMKPAPHPLITGMREWVDRNLPKPAPEGNVEKYSLPFAEGAGGALSLGGRLSLTNPLTVGISGGAANASAEAAREFAPEGWKEPAAAVTGFAVGMASPYALSWANSGVRAALGQPSGNSLRQSSGQREIREALDTATPFDFVDAATRARRWENQGIRSGTAAELFPRQVRAAGLARQVAAGPFGNQLQNRLENRADDLQNIRDRMPGAFGPGDIDPTTVANRTANAANAVIANEKTVRSTAIDNRLAGQEVPKGAVQEIFRDLLRLERAAKRPEEAEAIRQVALALRQRDGKSLQTDLQALSLAIKNLKTNPPTENASTGTKISNEDLQKVVRIAEDRLKSVSPVFREAMDDFRAFTRARIDPLKEGGIGRLDDKNPNVVDPTPVGRLESWIGNTSPENLSRDARRLSDRAILGPNAMSVDDIAKAVVQQRLRQGSTDPGKALRGEPGSLSERQLFALADRTSRGGAELRGLMQTADELQPLGNPIPTRGVVERSPGEAIATPYTAARMGIQRWAQQRRDQEIARLLSDPRNLPELQRIAMFDPTIRAQISRVIALQQALASQEVEGN